MIMVGSDMRAVVSNPGCGKIFISCPRRTDCRVQLYIWCILGAYCKRGVRRIRMSGAIQYNSVLLIFIYSCAVCSPRRLMKYELKGGGGGHGVPVLFRHFRGRTA